MYAFMDLRANNNLAYSNIYLLIYLLIYLFKTFPERSNSTHASLY